MPRAAIIAIDDDHAVLNSVERDLRQKYGRDYRIVKAESGQSALDVVHQLQARGEAVALFVADQRMPMMSGVEFLTEAIKVFPDARKVLLTAYADTAAAIDAINKVGLDYYLMKPWDPPQENLYPVLDGLLEDWKANTKPAFEGIRMVGALWSSASHELKDFSVEIQFSISISTSRPTLPRATWQPKPTMMTRACRHCSSPMAAFWSSRPSVGWLKRSGYAPRHPARFTM